MTFSERHPVEAQDSWESYLGRHEQMQEEFEQDLLAGHRFLKKKHHHHHDDDDGVDLLQLEQDADEDYLEMLDEQLSKAEKKAHHKEKKHRKRKQALYRNPGIERDTVHGIMIDAGSTGSRLHLFEWEPRLLHNEDEVQQSVSGCKISVPGTESRWTDRLSPGISSFADVPDDQLVQKLADYFDPLMDFARNLLQSKQDIFHDFPIYLRATAGMRTLKYEDRARIITAVRQLFSNASYSPFYFEDEHARVISGEEEAIYGWAGVNFLLGTLIEDSQGAGTVVNPRLTYGALDLGGASTQISFHQPNSDIMSSLFKLQIGQGKHWNLYAHSFLDYGINQATERFEARLIDGLNADERIMQGVHNPCLPGGASKEIRNNIHFDEHGVETFSYSEEYGTGSGYQLANLTNVNKFGDYEECAELVYNILHKEQNDWCDFAHRGDCSFAGVYQPELPSQAENAGEFLAFSNFYHVWDFLRLPSRASLADLEEATKVACAMNEWELKEFAGDRVDDDLLNEMCFRSTYAFQLLRNGYGFHMDDYITATNIVAGQKVGWALGAMMYEINTLPWKYDSTTHQADIAVKPVVNNRYTATTFFFGVLVSGLALTLFSTFRFRRYTRRDEYEPIKSVDINV